MRQKELRIALVCYGGVSLAVYMHGVTKEVWKLAQASRAFHAGDASASPVEQVYLGLLQSIEAAHQVRLRVLPDILSGTSAGGINAVFLAQAIHSGQSLEPLTRLWLDNADVERLVAAEARPWSRLAKLWTLPFLWFLLRRSDNAVNQSVAPEARGEVRRKVAGLVRGRWFEPPFCGPGFARLLCEAFGAMARAGCGKPLLPAGHPLDLAVTATDFRGHRETLRMHSPPEVEESEHRITIAFRHLTPPDGGKDLAHLCELTLAARATASFPGAFPPMRIGEIDRLPEATQWPGRAKFLQRIMPRHAQQGTLAYASLVDGAVLASRPFASAIAAIRGRPAQREVDRRVVYIDPQPGKLQLMAEDLARPVGFFGAIFGALSVIPREQPIRDSLEALEAQSHEAAQLRQIVEMLRPEVDAVVEKLFGRTLFLDRPNPARLAQWRAKAQQAASERAGYAFHSYAQAKLAGIIAQLARLIADAAPQLRDGAAERIAARLRGELEARGLDRLADRSGGATPVAIAFLRAHDLSFRIRRLRLMARTLTHASDLAEDTPDTAALELARDSVYRALAFYFEREHADCCGPEFAELAANVLENPGAVLDHLAQRRLLPEVDAKVEAILAQALAEMPRPLRRRMLLTYLGFPFYDVATLPLLRNEGLTEFDPVKVDRISPDDARSIREGGAEATLRGTDFYSFGAFFSRAYRENDYLWGRLHGAERMIDLVASTAPGALGPDAIKAVKRAAFLAICEEERARGLCAGGRVAALEVEIEERMAPDRSRPTA